MKYPKIKYKGQEYFQVGCKNCGNGDDWKVYTDKVDFLFQCKCGHIVKIAIPESETDNETRD